MRVSAAAFSLIVGVIAVSPALAQRPAGHDTTSRETPMPVPREDSSVTEHTIRINGQVVPYRAMAATILLRNDKDEPIGSLYYTAYTRTDTRDPSRRPLTFVYNGGPGSSSVWLHMGAFGPRRVVTVDAAPTPPPPYQLVDNASSLIDVTDLVFIDPIGTGFSKPVGKGEGKDFWGVDEDAQSLEQFVSRYVSRNHRWNSPKYLLGESYGTTRSAVLVNRLQSNEGMAFNGVILVSSVLDFETLRFAPGHDISYVLYLPSYAATAAYHHMIPAPPDMKAFLTEVRQFAAGEYADALALGARLPAARRATLLTRLSAYTGLSEGYLDKANLRVRLGQFMEELARSDSLTTGRLDSRFQGPMMDLLSETADYDPQSPAVTGAFTAAINTYLRDELNYGGDQPYAVSGRVTWNWARGRGGWSGATYVGSDLARAMVTNPNLQIEIENGYYDMATPFFATEYTVDHLDLPARLRQNITLTYYEAGHMMYLHEAELARLKSNVAGFINRTSRTR
ncbi:MAG: S10 family peptidase [Gemmatimonadales bacterium]